MLFGQDHVKRYVETDGEEGHDWQGTTTLILTTTGRRTGEQRSTPLIYQPDGDAYLVVASKGGADEPPAWYLNLEADPEVHVQVRGDRFAARRANRRRAGEAGHVAEDGGSVARLRRLPAEDRPRDSRRRALSAYERGAPMGGAPTPMLLLIPDPAAACSCCLWVLAIPAVDRRFAARKLIGDAVASAVRSRIGVAPTIGFGSKPLLLQLVGGKLDTVTVARKGARIDGLPPLSLSATLRDVHMTHLTSLEGAIGSLGVVATLSPAGVADLLATPSCVASLPPSGLVALTRRPRVLLFPGRVDLLPPLGRAVELRFRPEAAANTIVFALSAFERAGAPVPTAELASAGSRAHCTRALANLPFGIGLDSATARSGALDLGFHGANASFSALG